MVRLLAGVALVIMLGIGVGVGARAQDAATPPADATPNELYCATPLSETSASPVSTAIAPGTAATPGGAEPGEAIGLYPCGTPGASPVATPAAAGTTAGATAPSVEMVDIKYSQTAITIPANTDVVVTLTNKGVLVHNFNIDELNVHSGDYASQQTGTVTINAPAGTYQYYCAVPGHKDIGMVGTLTVQ